MSDHAKSLGAGISELLLDVKRIDSQNKLWYLLGIVQTTRYWIAPEERTPILNGLEHARVIVQEASVSAREKGPMVEAIAKRIQAINEMPKERPVMNDHAEVPAQIADQVQSEGSGGYRDRSRIGGLHM